MEWRSKEYRHLSTISEISPELVEALSEIHIETLEDLIAYYGIPSLGEELCNHLPCEMEWLNSLISEHRRTITSDIELDLLAPIPDELLEEFSFDCLEPTQEMVREITAPEEEESGEFYLALMPTDEVNHIPGLFDIRSQGKRGACVAFGTVAMREFLSRKKYELSEQYLYWGAKMRDGKPESKGTWVRYAMQCLEENGVCLRTEWPYNQLPVETEHQGPPPRKAVQGAKRFIISKKISINPRSVNDLRSIIHGNEKLSGRVISFAIPVFRSWHQNPITYRTGRIVMPLPSEIPVGGHCMTLVGFKDDPAWPGGGFFILRNSWGTSWASQSSYGAGYGTIPYDFIALHCWEAWTAEVKVETQSEQVPVTESEEKIEEQLSASMSRESEATRIKKPKRRYKSLVLGILLLLVIGFGLADHFAPFRGIFPEFLPRLRKWAVKSIQKNYELHVSRGDGYFDRGLYQEASTSYEEALKIRGSDPEIHFKLGLAYYGFGKLKKAIEEMEIATIVNPENIEYHFNLGLLYSETGTIDKAIERWRRVVEINPNHDDAKILIDMYSE
jgi:hypothetical protein